MRLTTDYLLLLTLSVKLNVRKLHTLSVKTKKLKTKKGSGRSDTYCMALKLSVTQSYTQMGQGAACDGTENCW